MILNLFSLNKSILKFNQSTSALFIYTVAYILHIRQIQNNEFFSFTSTFL